MTLLLELFKDFLEFTLKVILASLREAIVQEVDDIEQAEQERKQNDADAVDFVQSGALADVVAFSVQSVDHLAVFAVHHDDLRRGRSHVTCRALV